MKRLIYFLPLIFVVFAIPACDKNASSDDFSGNSSKKTTIIYPCKEETAWVFGLRYLSKGTWATYVTTPAQENWGTEAGDVSIYAGQNMLAGRASFHYPYPDQPGYVRIKFWLNRCWSLQDVEEAIKIQGYDTAPIGVKPVPGNFLTYKGNGLLGQWGYIYVVVPYYPYYGIHLDLQNCCE